MSTYQPPLKPTPYGLHVPYDQGYDARSHRNSPTAENNSPSGFFKHNGSQIDVWIHTVTADFSLSGQSGQSRMLREFFPRSFNDVVLNIKGQVASSQEYNRLALFVREAHWNALTTINQGLTASPLITFVLHNPNSHWDSAKRNTKGSHKPWIVSGYIKLMQAGAIRHEVAPEFSIDFIVAESTLNANTGIWGDSLAHVAPLTSMKDLVNVARQSDRAAGGGFVQDPVAALNAQNTQQAVSSVVWSISGAISTLKLF